VGKELTDSQWAGMSGSVVFAGEVVVGVVVTHHLPEGPSELGVVPIAAIDTLKDRREWWQLVGNEGVDLVTLPEEQWEATLLKEDRKYLQVWTNADFRLGFVPRDKSDERLSLGPGESVDLAVLRQGRLHGLQQRHITLGKDFDAWIKPDESQKREERLRILWIEADPGPTRSEALLACLARAGMNGRAVYDTGQSASTAINTFIGATQTKRLPVPPLIGLDLPEVVSADTWSVLRTAINRARTNLAARADKYSRLADPYPRIVIAGTAKQGQSHYTTLQHLIEMRTVDPKGRIRQRPYSFQGMLSMETERLSASDVFNRGLPMTARRLFGRDPEVNELREAWESDQTRVFSIVASGGTGKSALVNTWLQEMHENDYCGAEKVFAWSFYSQGTKDNLVSADPFVNYALEWLGAPKSVGLNPWAKGRALAELIMKHKFLLVLDGMEPLQHPLGAPDVGGRLTDDSIRALLEELSQSQWNGLCIVTTRVPLTDLHRFESSNGGGYGTVESMELENLDVESGAALLQHIIQVRSTRDVLESAVRQVGSHALAITLLGNYLRDVHNGDLSGVYDIEEITVDPKEGGHARRIMASYIKWLSADSRAAELALLFLVGLFDRPATKDALEALIGDRGLRRFTGALKKVDGPVWNQATAALRGMGLLNNALPGQPGTIDAHPLVREHFRAEIEKQDAAFWQAGNRTLYRYYCDLAPRRPASATKMTLLYSAVSHGCAAGLHQEVFEDILVKRVWRDRRTNFSTRRLGMIGSDLVALSNYFASRWVEVLDFLPSRSKVLIMTNAGVRLRQLGRLADAQECFGSVVSAIREENAEPQDFEDGSYAAAQYCELLVIAGALKDEGGQVNTAVENGERAIYFADRGKDPYFKMHARSSLAEAYFMLNDLERAALLFEQAREIDRAQHPRPPFLYSQSLFRYGYYLIETGKAHAILTSSSADPGWGRNRSDSSLLSEAIRLLIIGAAYVSVIEDGSNDATLVGKAAEVLDESINSFRTAGYADYLVRGLLERAHFRRVQGRLHGERAEFHLALEDLERAEIEADGRAMDLLYVDVLLQKAGTYISMLEGVVRTKKGRLLQQANDCLNGAAELIGRLGYKRRDCMLVELRSRLER
jgi:tetratricopeptide (TPR) repeat protein